MAGMDANKKLTRDTRYSESIIGFPLEKLILFGTMNIKVIRPIIKAAPNMEILILDVPIGCSMALWFIKNEINKGQIAVNIKK